MATTFTKIAAVSVGVLGSSTISFTSIPSTYTDLCLVLSARNDYALNSDSYRFGTLQFNSVGTNQTSRFLTGDGSTTGSGSDTAIYFWTPKVSATSNTFGSTSFYVPNYAGSNNKSVSIDNVTENNATNVFSVLEAGLWSSSAAITSITLTSGSSSNFVQYSTATLYGIKN